MAEAKIEMITSIVLPTRTAGSPVPMLVYHSTDSPVMFELAGPGTPAGPSFFSITENNCLSKPYSCVVVCGLTAGPQRCLQYAVRLSEMKLLVIDHDAPGELQELLHTVATEFKWSTLPPDQIKQRFSVLDRYTPQISADIRQYLRAKGVDGVVETGNNGAHWHLFVFEPARFLTLEGVALSISTVNDYKRALGLFAHWCTLRTPNVFHFLVWLQELEGRDYASWEIVVSNLHLEATLDCDRIRVLFTAAKLVTGH